MKNLKSFTILFIMLLFMFIGCNNSKELTEAEKKSIIKEVTTVFEEGINAANKHDANAMMQVHWNSQDYMASIDGVLLKGWEPVFNVVSSVHSNPNYQSFTVDYDELIIKVISEDAALITSTGNILNVPSGEGLKSTKYVATILMEKKNGKWLKTNVHESTQVDVFK